MRGQYALLRDALLFFKNHPQMLEPWSQAITQWCADCEALGIIATPEDEFIHVCKFKKAKPKKHAQ